MAYNLDRNVTPPLPTYLCLNQSGASRSQLTHYLHRTGWLTFSQSGTFTDDMLTCVQSSDCVLVFPGSPTPPTRFPDRFWMRCKNTRR